MHQLPAAACSARRSAARLTAPFPAPFQGLLGGVGAAAVGEPLKTEDRRYRYDRISERLELMHQNLGFAKLKPDPPHTALYNTEMKSSAACVCHKYTHRDLKLLTSSLPVGS